MLRKIVGAKPPLPDPLSFAGLEIYKKILTCQQVLVLGVPALESNSFYAATPINSKPASYAIWENSLHVQDEGHLHGQTRQHCIVLNSFDVVHSKADLEFITNIHSKLPYKEPKGD